MPTGPCSNGGIHLVSSACLWPASLSSAYLCPACLWSDSIACVQSLRSATPWAIPDAVTKSSTSPPPPLHDYRQVPMPQQNPQQNHALHGYFTPMSQVSSVQGSTSAPNRGPHLILKSDGSPIVHPDSRTKGALKRRLEEDESAEDGPGNHKKARGFPASRPFVSDRHPLAPSEPQGKDTMKRPFIKEESYIE